MRILLILATLLMYACNSPEANKEQEISNNSIAQINDFKTLDTIISFAGYWVNEQYVDSIKVTKSPVNTTIPENSCISIPNRTLEITGMISGFHEGGEGLKILKNGAYYEFWDETLEHKRYDISVITSGRIKIGNSTFIKINYVNDPNSDTQPTILEELLFNGVYSKNDGSTVEFTKNGFVKGLDDFTTYSAYVDYADQSMQVNQVGLGTTKANEKNYGYKFTKDTLSIYELDCIDVDSSTNNCLEVTFGKLKCKLIKRD